MWSSRALCITCGYHAHSVMHVVFTCTMHALRRQVWLEQHAGDRCSLPPRLRWSRLRLTLRFSVANVAVFMQGSCAHIWYVSAFYIYVRPSLELVCMPLTHQYVFRVFGIVLSVRNLSMESSKSCSRPHPPHFKPP